MDWDDLRIIAAIRDSGTFAGAGVRLGMDETTISRRLARLQKTLGVSLFTATDGVRKPTPHCEQILDHVQEIAQHVAEIGALGNAARGVAGHIRLATVNSVAEEILAPKSAEFLVRNPGLTLQLLTSGQNVNFARWEADLAVRLRKPEKGNFTITKLADVRLYLFEPRETIENLFQTVQQECLASRPIQSSFGSVHTRYRELSGRAQNTWHRNFSCFGPNSGNGPESTANSCYSTIEPTNGSRNSTKSARLPDRSFHYVDRPI